MNSTNDKLNGTFNSSVGKVKEMAGKAIDNQDLEVEGNIQKNRGKGQQVVGALKDKIKEGSHLLGDNIEKVGRKLQEKGHEKTGSVIEKLGDKLEHIAD